jgi:hypothetical protein
MEHFFDNNRDTEKDNNCTPKTAEERKFILNI